MTRNAGVDYTKYVHEFTNDQGQTRYAVAEYNEETGQYTRPLTMQESKDTGCLAEFCHNLNYFGGYISKTKALRRARYVFGQSDKMEG